MVEVNPVFMTEEERRLSGYIECSHCHGYGSSLKDPIGVDVCTKCQGKGLVIKDTKNKEQTTCSL